MEAQGLFMYGNSAGFSTRDVKEKTESSEENLTTCEDGGEMQILIDYENVGTAGLNGSEYLCDDDRISLFYSSSSSNIERQYIEAMERQSGSFDVFKLRTVGKNGLDFYIAVKVGQIAETSPKSKILIVTRDNGYQAIRDYCQNYTALKDRIIIKGSIEEGIVAMDGDTVRRQIIRHKRKKLSIEAEYSAYAEREKLGRNIAEACRGTEFEGTASKIIEMIDAAVTPRDRYLSSLRTFGRNEGTKIYRIIKGVV